MRDSMAQFEEYVEIKVFFLKIKMKMHVDKACSSTMQVGLISSGYICPTHNLCWSWQVLHNCEDCVVYGDKGKEVWRVKILARIMKSGMLQLK